MIHDLGRSKWRLLESLVPESKYGSRVDEVRRKPENDREEGLWRGGVG